MICNRKFVVIVRIRRFSALHQDHVRRFHFCAFVEQLDSEIRLNLGWPTATLSLRSNSIYVLLPSCFLVGSGRRQPKDATQAAKSCLQHCRLASVIDKSSQRQKSLIATRCNGQNAVAASSSNFWIPGLVACDQKTRGMMCGNRHRKGLCKMRDLNSYY